MSRNFYKHFYDIIDEFFLSEPISVTGRGLLINATEG